MQDNYPKHISKKAQAFYEDKKTWIGGTLLQNL